jgi:hypothetical protein
MLKLAIFLTGENRHRLKILKTLYASEHKRQLDYHETNFIFISIHFLLPSYSSPQLFLKQYQSNGTFEQMLRLLFPVLTFQLRFR